MRAALFLALLLCSSWALKITQEPEEDEQAGPEAPAAEEASPEPSHHLVVWAVLIALACCYATYVSFRPRAPQEEARGGPGGAGGGGGGALSADELRRQRLARFAARRDARQDDEDDAAEKEEHAAGAAPNHSAKLAAAREKTQRSLKKAQKQKKKKQQQKEPQPPQVQQRHSLDHSEKLKEARRMMQANAKDDEEREEEEEEERETTLRHSPVSASNAEKLKQARSKMTLATSPAAQATAAPHAHPVPKRTAHERALLKLSASREQLQKKAPSTASSSEQGKGESATQSPEFRIHFKLQEIFQFGFTPAQLYSDKYTLLEAFDETQLTSKFPLCALHEVDSLLFALSEKHQSSETFLRFLLSCLSRVSLAGKEISDTCRRCIATQSMMHVHGGALLKLLLGPGDGAPFVRDFLELISDAAQSEGMLDELCEPLFLELMQNLSLQAFWRHSSAVFSVLTSVVHTPLLASKLASTDFFKIPERGNGASLERTLLGACFRAVHALDNSYDGPLATFFLEQRVKEADVPALVVSKVSAHLEQLETLFEALLREPSTATVTREWLIAAVRMNADRRKLRYDHVKVCSHGFGATLTSFMLRLFRKKFRPDAPVDPAHWLRALDLGWLDSTPNEGSVEVSEWIKSNRRNPHKSSELSSGDLLFLTLGSVNVGLASLARILEPIRRHAFTVIRQFSTLEAQRHGATPAFLQNLENCRKMADKARLWLTAWHAQVFHEALRDDVRHFYCELSAWLLKLQRGEDGCAFGALPDFVVADMSAVLQMHFQAHNANLNGRGSQGALVEFLASNLGNKDKLSNQYARGQMAEVLSCFPVDSFSARLELVVSSVVNLWVDTVNQNGRHNDYHEKQSVRSSCCSIMNNLRLLPGFAAQLRKVKADNMEDFSNRFVGLALDDANLMFDEILLSLKTIGELEHEINNFGHQMSAEEKQEKRERLDQSRSICQSSCRYAPKLMELIHTLAKLVPDALLHNEHLADRCANTLDYVITKLAGPERVELRVSLASNSYLKLDPGKLLYSCLDTHVLLSTHDAFVEAVARDDRCFSRPKFYAILATVRSDGADIAVIRAFERLTERAGKVRDALEEAHAAVDDAPEEFLCGLMGTIMRDPVIVRGTDDRIDRVTMERHLASTPTNPFTREPMTVDDLKTDEALKARIEAYLREKRSSPTIKK